MKTFLIHFVLTKTDSNGKQEAFGVPVPKDIKSGPPANWISANNEKLNIIFQNSIIKKDFIFLT